MGVNMDNNHKTENMTNTTEVLDTQKSPISVPSISYIGCVIRGTKSTYEIAKS